MNELREQQGLLFQMGDGEATLAGVSETTPMAGALEDGVLRIPAAVDGLPVRRIEERALWGAGEMLHAIIVPPGVREIGDLAFIMNGGLASIELPEGLCVLGSGIVDLTLVEELSLPSTVREIKEPYTYNGIHLAVAAENPFWKSDGRGLYQKKADEAGTGSLVLRGLHLEAGVSLYQVKEGTWRIGPHALDENDDLQALHLPDGLREIGDFAFSGCDRLNDLKLPESLETLGEEPFHSCESLHRLRLPRHLLHAGRHAFTDTFNWLRNNHGLCDLQVEEDNPVFYVENGSLMEQRGKDTVLLKYLETESVYDIPPGTTSIDALAFLRSDVTDLGIPSSVIHIGTDAFCGMERIRIMRIEQDHTMLYIPQEPAFRKEEILEGFYDRAQTFRDAVWHYDYEAYDAAFTSYYYTADKVRMACGRLLAPCDLSQEAESIYLSWLTEHLDEIARDLAGAGDREGLQILLQAGIVDADTVDRVVESVARCGQPDLLSWIMEEKQERFGVHEIDFSL